MKLIDSIAKSPVYIVALRRRAWIETDGNGMPEQQMPVALRRRAWIETDTLPPAPIVSGRVALRRRAWIETTRRI